MHPIEFEQTFKYINMSSIISTLFFDKELVSTIKKSNPDINFLYTQLISGKITLQEYVTAAKA